MGADAAGNVGKAKVAKAMMLPARPLWRVFCPLEWMTAISPRAKGKQNGHSRYRHRSQGDKAKALCSLAGSSAPCRWHPILAWR